MQITCKDNNLVIKTGRTKIVLDSQIQIGEFKIPGPGEYEITGVFAQGFSPKLFSFRTEGMLVVFFEPNRKDIEKNLDGLSETEILILKNGETDISKEVAETLSRLEPKIVVPIGFKNIAKLMKSEGVVEEVESYKVSKQNLLAEGRKIIVLPCSKKV